MNRAQRSSSPEDVLLVIPMELDKAGLLELQSRRRHEGRFETTA